MDSDLKLCEEPQTCFNLDAGELSMLNNFDQRFNGIGIRIDIVDMCFDRSIGGIHHCLEERLVCVPPGPRMAIGNARQTSSDQNIFFKPCFCNLLSRQCYH